MNIAALSGDWRSGYRPLSSDRYIGGVSSPIHETNKLYLHCAAMLSYCHRSQLFITNVSALQVTTVYSLTWYTVISVISITVSADIFSDVLEYRSISRKPISVVH